MNKVEMVHVFNTTTHGQNSDTALNWYVCILVRSHSISQIIIKTLYRVNRKTANFHAWQEQRSAHLCACNLDKYWTRWYPNETDHIYLWIGNWVLFIRQKVVQQHLHVCCYYNAFHTHGINILYLRNKSAHFMRDRELCTHCQSLCGHKGVPDNDWLDPLKGLLQD